MPAQKMEWELLVVVACEVSEEIFTKQEVQVWYIAIVFINCTNHPVVHCKLCLDQIVIHVAAKIELRTMVFIEKQCTTFRM